MKSVFALLALLAFALPGHAQTVASCSTATPGAVWAHTPPAATTWLPCTSAVAYVAQPLPPATLITDMRCAAATCNFSWTAASAIQPTDHIWANTAAAPKGAWVLASTIKVAAATVTPPPSALASVAWTAPTANVDGTPLTTLAGFNVYSGTSATTMTVIATTGPTVLGYAGKIPYNTPIFFAVTTLSSAASPAVESAKSNVVSLSVASPTALTPNPPVITVPAP